MKRIRPFILAPQFVPNRAPTFVNTTPGKTRHHRRCHRLENCSGISAATQGPTFVYTAPEKTRHHHRFENCSGISSAPQFFRKRARTFVNPAPEKPGIIIVIASKTAAETPRRRRPTEGRRQSLAFRRTRPTRGRRPSRRRPPACRADRAGARARTDRLTFRRRLRRRSTRGPSSPGC